MGTVLPVNGPKRRIAKGVSTRRPRCRLDPAEMACPVFCVGLMWDVGRNSELGEFYCCGCADSKVVGQKPSAPTMLGTWNYGIWH